LRLAADRMNRGFARVYQAYLLRQLRQVLARNLKNHETNLPPAFTQLESFRCFWTFDDQVTAPMNGFVNVHDYYRQASSRQFLPKIVTPTLIIHALDDPFMTPSVVPAADELSKDVTLEVSQKGGHVGFITGNLPGMPVYWLDQRIPEFLQTYLD